MAKYQKRDRRESRKLHGTIAEAATELPRSVVIDSWIRRHMRLANQGSEEGIFTLHTSEAFLYAYHPGERKEIAERELGL